MPDLCAHDAPPVGIWVDDEEWLGCPDCGEPLRRTPGRCLHNGPRVRRWYHGTDTLHIVCAACDTPIQADLILATVKHAPCLCDDCGDTIAAHFDVGITIPDGRIICCACVYRRAATEVAA